MLRAKIFDGLGCLSRQIVRAFDKFILGRDVDVKCLSIADHIKNVFGHHRGLADYAYTRGLGGEQEPVYFVILLDHTGVSRARRQFHADCGIQRGDGLSLLIIAPDEVIFARAQKLRRSVGGLDDRFLADGATADKRCRRGQRNYVCKGRGFRFGAAPQKLERQVSGVLGEGGRDGELQRARSPGNGWKNGSKNGSAFQNRNVHSGPG